MIESEMVMIYMHEAVSRYFKFHLCLRPIKIAQEYRDIFQNSENDVLIVSFGAPIHFVP